MESAFKHDVNVNGEWQPALVHEAQDANNGWFAVWNVGDGTWSHVKASRGEDTGQFRDRQ